MANKTQPHDGSVEDFLNSVEDEQKRKDAWQVLNMMKEITGYEPVLWGPSIVGFGTYHYKYESGREGDFMRTGFSPRKTALTVYIMPGFGRYEELMAKLGKYKTGKSCLYIKRLSDVDLGVLRELIAESVAYMDEKYPRN
ncbi:MAG: hypothetical protein Kow0027_14910 [Saprospiraceae bacterium]